MAWLGDPARSKVLHDAKGPMLALAARGWPLRGLVSDTALAAYLVRPDQRSYDLADLTLRYLKRELKQGSADDDQLSLEGLDGGGGDAADTAMLHARAVLDLADTLDGEIEQTGGTSLLADVELPLVDLLAVMEQTGIAVDTDHLESLESHFASEVRDAAGEAFRVIGKEINLGSPKQLQVVLFDELAMPKTKRTKTGYTTDADALQALYEKTEHPFLMALLRHRDVSRLRQTIEGLLKTVQSDGRIHTTFNQTIAATGRLSSTDPNLQNIPIRTEEGRRIREGFVVGQGFDCLMTADYSQIEMRIMAHLSEDALLIEAFKSGQDFHSITASRVFGVPAEDVTGGQRAKIKAMNYGLAYGLSAFGLGAQLRIDPGRGPRADGRVLRDVRWRPRLPRRSRRRGTPYRLHRDPLGPAPLPPRPDQRQPSAPRDGRADGAQRADPGLGGRPDQDRDAPRRRARSARRGWPHGCCSRCTTSSSSRSRPASASSSTRSYAARWAAPRISPSRSTSPSAPAAAGTTRRTDARRRESWAAHCSGRAHRRGAPSRGCGRTHALVGDEQHQHEHGVHTQHDAQQAEHGVRGQAEADDRREGDPGGVDAPAPTAGDEPVDDHHQTGQQRAEDGEEPQARPYVVVPRAADEDQREAREQSGGQRAEAPRTATDPMAAMKVRELSPEAIEGKATIETNCGRNSTALARIRPAAYRPASCELRTCRATIRSHVAEREEREQGLGVVHHLPHQRAETLACGTRPQVTVPEGVHPDGDRGDQRDRDRDRGPPGIRPPQREGHAEHQSRGTDADVDRRQRPPAAFALQDARQAADHGQRHGGDAQHGGHHPVVQLQGDVDDRRQGQQDRAEGERGHQCEPDQVRLDVVEVVLTGGESPGGRGLQPQEADVDDEQEVHPGREGAVPGRAEDVGARDREAVRRHVHDEDGDRDAATAPDRGG